MFVCINKFKRKNHLQNKDKWLCSFFIMTKEHKKEMN